MKIATDFGSFSLPEPAPCTSISRTRFRGPSRAIRQATSSGAVGVLPKTPPPYSKNSPRETMASNSGFRDEIIAFPHWTRSRGEAW